MYIRAHHHHRNLNQLLIIAFMFTLSLFSYLMPYFFVIRSLVAK